MNNSEILFIYDAKLTNPNGDPDDENRPRMDYDTSTNLVSDVRLKRYIRDYLKEKGEEIFVSTVDDKVVDATSRLKALFKKAGKNDNLKNIKDEDRQFILHSLIDVRLFGATMPIKSEDTKGNSVTYTGPVQFNWGYSLNPVSIVESSSITSRFSSDSANSQGAMGKDYRVYYSLIAFSGMISGKRADKTGLQEEDIRKLDQALILSIPNLATRSKIGQYPRLYMRVEYNDSETFLGDFRSKIHLNEKNNLRDISQVQLNIDRMVTLLQKNKDRIRSIHYYVDEEMGIFQNGQQISFCQALDGFELIPVKE